MNASAPAPAVTGLGDLLRRVTTGIERTVAEQWEPPSPEFIGRFLPEPTRTRWQTWSRALMSGGEGLTCEEVDATVQDLAGRLATDRDTLLTAVHHPAAWLEALTPAGARPLDLHSRWTMWCWAVEALWAATHRSPTSLVDTDARFARPLAARLRFLVLTEAFRHRGERATGWLLPAEAALPGHVPFTRVFGERSWYLLVGRAREARWAWQGYLDTFQSHPVLAGAEPGQIDQEFDALLFCHGNRGPALQITGNRLDQASPAGPDDLAVRQEVTQGHLLPRMRLPQVAALAYPGWRSRSTRTAALAALSGVAAFLLAGVVSRWVAGPACFTAGVWAAGGCYLLIAFGAVREGALFTAPWMLRWPAAAALGLIALAGLNPHWWRDLTGPTVAKWGLPWPPALLATVSYGYLLIEARNHAVTGRTALGRALRVMLGGLGHAGLVSLVGVVAILPAFADPGDGPGLHHLFTAANREKALLVWATASGWCLAAGVFSQILWDDRPITAPLAHTGWRAGRQT
jgi:hypothetical protein